MRQSSRAFRSASRGGFTLVELLAAMMVMLLLVALLSSGFQSLNAALGLTTSTQATISELITARQTALTRDVTVQVRFYQFPDTTGATNTREYQAMQSFWTTDGVTYTPLDKVSFLPANIMISANATYSSPLGSITAIPAATTDLAIQSNGIGKSYSYVSVNFKSSGSIDPQVASWFITLHEKRYAVKGTPVNFTTISVDPQNGRLRMFQP